MAREDQNFRYIEQTQGIVISSRSIPAKTIHESTTKNPKNSNILTPEPLKLTLPLESKSISNINICIRQME